MTQEEYDQAAQAYLESLPLEHFMEAEAQAFQRSITLASLALLRPRIPNFHLFSELLVQYSHDGALRQVVPDNMVVLGPLRRKRKRTNFPVALEESPVFWTLEYVSESNRRKDYEDNFRKYGEELKVPYYLLFEPDPEPPVLRLFHHDGQTYQEVAPNAEGRLEVPELDLAVGLLDGWARFWHRGDLLALPEELQERLALQDERLEELEDTLELREDQLRQRTDEVRQRDSQLAGVAAALRPLVETRARLAGREDILAALPATSDTTVLTRWLTELG